MMYTFHDGCPVIRFLVDDWFSLFGRVSTWCSFSPLTPSYYGVFSIFSLFSSFKNWKTIWIFKLVFSTSWVIGSQIAFWTFFHDMFSRLSPVLLREFAFIFNFPWWLLWVGRFARWSRRGIVAGFVVLFAIRLILTFIGGSCRLANGCFIKGETTWCVLIGSCLCLMEHGCRRQIVGERCHWSVNSYCFSWFFCSYGLWRLSLRRIRAS